MTRWIVGSSLQFRLLVVAVAAVVMTIGVVQLRNAPMDILPEFDAPYVEVQTEALGLSAAEVEQLVTVPLEADLLNGVAWLKTMHSESMPGLSSIIMEFEPGTDIMHARQVVGERLTQAHALPNVSKAPVMVQPLSSTARIMNVGLKSDDLSLIEMSVLARWTMKPRLMGVPGVAHVSIWGQRRRQLQVHVDPEKLRAEGLTLNEIVETTGDALWVSPLTWLEASYPGTGGFIETANQRLGIRHVLPITSPEDLGEVAVSGRKDMVLADVTTVVEDHPPLIGDAIVDDGSGLILVIEKFPWASTLEVTSGVEVALAALAPGLGGMQIDSRVYRPATYIENASANFKKAWMIGLALVAVALFLLLMEWRVALISLISIPLSLVAAALVLYRLEGSFDSMVLAGLVVALGVVVDDAVSDTRSILRRLRQHRAEGGKDSVAKVILESCVEKRSAMVFATVILLLIAAPAFTLFGVTGAIVKPIAVSYILALLASLAVTLSVTPALALFFFPNGAAPGGDSPLLRGLSGAFGGLVGQGVRAPAAAIVAIVVLGIAGIAVFMTMERDDIVPTFKRTNILVRVEAIPGTGPDAMRRIVTKAGAELRTISGVRNVGAHIGRAVLSDEVVNVNSSEIWVSIDPNADYDATIDAINVVVDGHAGLSRQVFTYGGEQVEKALRGKDKDLVVRVYGENRQKLLEEAERVRQVMAQVDGVVDPQLEEQIVEPIVQIEADMAACERHGIKPGDIRRASAILLAGIEVGMLFEDQKVFDVVVWGEPELRHSVTAVKELLIDTPGGGHVRLEQVATVKVTSAPQIIHREGVSRRTDVYASVNGNLDAVSEDVTEALQAMTFPLEFHAAVMEESEERAVANRRARNLAIACAIGALLLMQAAFGSWRLGAIAFLALPLALSGAAIAVRLGGGLLSIGSMIGFVTIFGIALRQTIATINHFQRAGENFGPELVQEGMRERIGSILSTLIVTGLAVLPLVLFGNIAGQEVLHPMAIAILGGLVTTTLLSVYVVPAIYMQFGKDANPEWVADEDEDADNSRGLQYAKG